MLAKRWSEVKQILSGALELDPAQRPAFLMTACSGDASLMQEVQSLLDAYEKGGSWLEQPAAVSQGLAVGDKLGNYQIEALIGTGGMGEVYRAVDTTLGLAVAIKVLPPALSSDPLRLFRLEQEARAAAALSHPNILYVHRLDHHENLLYVVSELLEGRTLRRVAARSFANCRHTGVCVADRERCSPPRTKRASFTATSSLRTCSLLNMDKSRSSILD